VGQALVDVEGITTGDQAVVIDMSVAKIDSLARGYTDEEAKLDCPAAVASINETAGLAEDELRLTADLAPGRVLDGTETPALQRGKALASRGVSGRGCHWQKIRLRRAAAMRRPGQSGRR